MTRRPPPLDGRGVQLFEMAEAGRRHAYQAQVDVVNQRRALMPVPTARVVSGWRCRGQPCLP